MKVKSEKKLVHLRPKFNDGKKTTKVIHEFENNPINAIGEYLRNFKKES